MKKAQKIIAIVEKTYGLKEGTLTGKRRLHHIAYARHAAMYCCKEFTDLKWRQLGRIFNMMHSSVIVGHRNTQIRIQKDKELYDMIQTIRKLS